MGKPPTFNVKNGPYHFSPGPAAYTLRNPVDSIDTVYNVFNGDRSRSISKSPKRLDGSFDFNNRKTTSKFATLNNGNGTVTLSNSILRESAAKFGSSERVPLDIKQKFDFPGPGSYSVKDKLVYPKCRDVNFGVGKRGHKFLQTSGYSPGPARYNHKAAIGKDLESVDQKYSTMNNHSTKFGKRNNSVFAMTGKQRIMQ